MGNRTAESSDKAPGSPVGWSGRARLSALYLAVIGIHALGWGLLISQARRYPMLLGLGTLAYGFGLRHAFDADHISAIDNTTRKLLQGGKKPLATGLFFSLGHSTVVLLIALALGLAVKDVVSGISTGNNSFRSFGGIIGTGVSGFFLLIIGVLNLLIFLDILGVFRRLRAGAQDRESLEENLVAGGVLTRLFAKLFRFVSSSWHMYPVGFLFGLGFDTATEVGLLAISAGAASKGLSLGAVIALPLIFASGMSLMDTTDGVFMSRAYSWAFSSPIKKLFYNMTVTGLSVFVALIIGLLEVLQVVGQLTDRTTGFWGAVANIDLGTVGYYIVGLFAATWIATALVFKFRRVEQRWSENLHRQR